MDIVEKHFKQTEQKIHTFHCDNCKKYLGMSEEWDDGYYKTFGDYEYQILVNHKLYRKRGTFCDDCKKEFEDNLVSVLKICGFKCE